MILRVTEVRYWFIKLLFLNFSILPDYIIKSVEKERYGVFVDYIENFVSMTSKLSRTCLLFFFSKLFGAVMLCVSK